MSCNSLKKRRHTDRHTGKHTYLFPSLPTSSVLILVRSPSPSVTITSTVCVGVLPFLSLSDHKTRELVGHRESRGRVKCEKRAHENVCLLPADGIITASRTNIFIFYYPCVCVCVSRVQQFSRLLLHEHIERRRKEYRSGKRVKVSLTHDAVHIIWTVLSASSK